MPKVRVPRKNVTPGEVVTVLSRRLGPGYQVESNGDRRVTVRKSPLKYATISIADQPGASVFRRPRRRPPFPAHPQQLRHRPPRGRRPAPLPRVPQPLTSPPEYGAELPG